MSVCNEKFQKAQEFQEKVIETTSSHKNQLKTAMEDTSKVRLSSRKHVHVMDTPLNPTFV